MTFYVIAPVFDRAWQNGVQPLVKRMLQKEDVPVIVQADAQAQSGLLVRIIDEAKLAGATKVSIASLRPKG